MGSVQTDVRSILKGFGIKLDELLSSQDEAARLDALELTLKPSRAPEPPKDAVFKISLSVGLGLNVYESLVNGGAATAKQLAVPKRADPGFVERILRVLATIEYVEECGPGLYAPNDLTKEMCQRTSVGIMDSRFCDCLPRIVQTPKFLQNTGYQNPRGPRAGPMQYALGTDLTIWEWLAESPEASARFNTYMEGTRGDRPHRADWFPVREQILDGAADDSTRPLLVDIAGGRGHDIAHFAARFQNQPGRLILEEPPLVIDDIATLHPRIERVKHDFFTPQPVKGSRVYYMKFILHDWSDEKCRAILDHVEAAMEKGYSKLLIEEFFIPDSGARQLPLLVDMVVMVWCYGMERTCSQ